MLRPKDDITCHACQPLSAQFDADRSKQLVAAISTFRRANPLATAFIVRLSPLDIRPLTEISQLDWSKAETDVSEGWLEGVVQLTDCLFLVNSFISAILIPAGCRSTRVGHCETCWHCCHIMALRERCAHAFLLQQDQLSISLWPAHPEKNQSAVLS